jgi:RNA polymerase sigma-70 factor (ECF subfamily)
MTNRSAPGEAPGGPGGPGAIEAHRIMPAYREGDLGLGTTTWEDDIKEATDDENNWDDIETQAAGDDDAIPQDAPSAHIAPLFENTVGALPSGPHADNDASHRGLLDRCVRGDESAFSALHRLLAPRMYGFLRYSFGHVARADIEDVISDTMYDVWKTAHQFRGESKVRVWILGIAFKKMCKLWKKNKRMPSEPLARFSDEELQRMQDNRAGPDCDPMDLVLGDKRMLDAMNQLTASQIECIYLIHFECLSREEVAELLGTSPKTVSSHLSQGLNKWLAILGRKG